jgi:hypothetical protein
VKSETVLVTCLAQRGNIGKSTCMTGLAAWLEQRGVPWQGFDLDPDHRSFSRLYPETTRLVEFGDEPEGDVIKVLRHVADIPVTLIDPRAHLSATVLKAWDMIQFPEGLAAGGGRVVALLFPSDDLDVMSDLDATVSRLGDRVRYVVVRNPARSPRTRMFDGSELEAELHRLGAAFLEIPVLLSLARNHIAAKEAELGRGLTHAEAVANSELGLDPIVRLLVEDWVRTLFRRLDDIAAHLLPTAFASKIAAPAARQVPSVAVRRGAKLNLKSL